MKSFSARIEAMQVMPCSVNIIALGGMVLN